MRQEFTIFKKYDFGYSEETSNSDWLGMLGECFTDGKPNNDWIKKRLIDPNSKGIVGNKVYLSFEGNKVLIQPLYISDPSEYRIETNRNQLLQVIQDWEKATKDKPDEIIMTRDEHGNITVEGKFYHKEEAK